MLLDEDPATLIHHTIGNFNIDPDKNAVGRINESLSALQQARDLRLREAESALRRLSRTLSTLKSQHAETTSTHSPTAHTNHILSLDTQKFRLAKTAADLEIENDHLSTTLLTLQAKLADLESQGLEGDDAEQSKRDMEDETLLRLKIYRSLKIDVEADGGAADRNGTGAAAAAAEAAAGADRGGAGVAGGAGFNKAIIRNPKKGDVHVVHIDPKFSRFFYANYFWGSM
ncbi:MAG: hypothetical protein M1819_005312 [Sarea resinae]|nr:MAG: hypothetical protein M1819_005312 [Sarea resinae]